MRMRPISALCSLLLLMLLVEEATSISRRNEMLSSFQAKLHEKSLSGPTKPPLSSLFEASNVTKDGRVFYPIGYGADPTGANDSTEAIAKALEEAFQLESSLEMLPGITDLGGVVIDLQGGNYKIAQPLRRIWVLQQQSSRSHIFIHLHPPNPELPKNESGFLHDLSNLDGAIEHDVLDLLAVALQLLEGLEDEGGG
ncbi:hypothetical protein ACLB2K_023503 [Fragaria x ananassa]